MRCLGLVKFDCTHLRKKAPIEIWEFSPKSSGYNAQDSNDSIALCIESLDQVNPNHILSYFKWSRPWPTICCVTRIFAPIILCPPCIACCFWVLNLKLLFFTFGFGSHVWPNVTHKWESCHTEIRDLSVLSNPVSRLSNELKRKVHEKMIFCQVKQRKTFFWQMQALLSSRIL